MNPELTGLVPRDLGLLPVPGVHPGVQNHRQDLLRVPHRHQRGLRERLLHLPRRSGLQLSQEEAPEEQNRYLLPRYSVRRRDEQSHTHRLTRTTTNPSTKMLNDVNAADLVTAKKSTSQSGLKTTYVDLST